LSVLIFHRVHAEPDPLFPFEMHARVFLERMKWVSRWFNVIPLAEGVAALGAGKLPARALSITFDDGYADNYLVALPLLSQLGLHATFFIASDFLDGGRMWNDTVIEAVRGAVGGELDLSGVGLGIYPITSPSSRAQAIGQILPQLKYLPPPVRTERVATVAALSRASLPTNLMLSSEQLRSMAAAGMTIGAHTSTHPILARIEEAQAEREIAGGRDKLEAITRQPITLFAYPNGKPDTDYTATHVRMVRRLGFSAAVSTAHGSADARVPVHELPRFTPWGATAARWSLGLAKNMLADPVRARE
jgi:peptidoglycan/xylan/chitin deacetylase (PgdA/CDA1 family)